MERIKKVRKRLGLSLNDVAEGSGLTPQAVARAERAGIDPRASTIGRIAKAMGVPTCEFFEESGHEQKRKRRKA